MQKNFHMNSRTNHLLASVCFSLLCLNLRANSYSTSFPLTENPISEAGRWVNGEVVGLDWKNVRTTSGFAFGTQSGTGGVDDSTALLSGAWGPNQTAQAVVRVVTTDNAQFEEVELRLRSNLSAHSCTGYEILFSVKTSTPYVQIVRWNGAFGQYDLLNNSGSAPVIQDGDEVKATIVGSIITAYVNGKAVCIASDSTWVAGNPGIGFYLQDSVGDPANYGFSKFSVTDGNGASPTPTILSISSINRTNGSVNLSGQGLANQSYIIQFAESAVSTNWQNLGTVTSDGFGNFNYVDYQGFIAARFYRAALTN